MKGRSDAELIRKSIAKPSLFEVVFDRHYNAVRMYAQRRLGVSDGEEIAAEAFEQAFAQRSRFDAENYSSARPWLIGITNNLVRRHLRHADVKRRLPPLSISIPESEPGPNLDSLEAASFGPLIRRALQRLSEADRETFLLVAQAELTYAEAAEAMGVPVGTVRSRVHRARRSMRELLTEAGAINPGGRDRGRDA